MKTPFRYLRLFLFINLLVSCHAGSFKLGYDDDSEEEDNQGSDKQGSWISSSKVFITGTGRITGRKGVTIPSGPSLAVKGENVFVVNKLSLSTPASRFFSAASSGKVRQLEKLLDEEEVTINIKDENGDTALILAARNGHLSVVEFLIGRGANKNRQNNDKQTALETAIRNRRRTITLELIHEKDRSLNALNDAGQTALMVAIEMGQQEIAFALIESGANLNRKDNRGWSALQYAREGGHEEIEKELLRHDVEE